MSTIWALLERRVALDPGALFAVDERGAALTVADARDRALLAAGALARDHGVRRGVVVSWQLPNWLDTVVLALALCRLQAVQNPIVPVFRQREVGFITGQAGTRLLVAPDATDGPKGCATLSLGRGALPAAQVDLPELVADPDNSVRWLFYTSGTTADPKGARHTDATLLAAARGVVEALGVTDTDRLATLLPLAHIGGVIRVVTSLLTGAAMLVSDVFDPSRSIPFLRERGATLIPGAVPFLHGAFDYQATHPELEPLFPAARAMIHGGAPKPPALHYEAKARLGTAGIVSGYGLTECPMSTWNRPNDADEDLATTEGLPAAGVEVRIVGPDEAVLPPGEEGEVRLRGGQLMRGYVDGALDAAAFDAGGFLRSGDLGVLDDRGRLTITGRLKEVIIRNMENISATELENLLHVHPKVRDVAVIGVPDELTGEQACAVVVPTDAAAPPDLGELAAHLLAAGLSKRKLPERLEIVDALPRNAMDKVLKADLRRRYGDHSL